MNTLIIGAGSVGSLFGALLAEAGHQVLLLDNHAQRAQAVNSRGLLVEGVGGARTIPMAALPLGDKTDFKPELALVTVKAYSTQQAARDLEPYLDADTPVLSIQNGVGNVEILQAAIGGDRVLAGTTSNGANTVAPGHIRHAGQGDTFIGEVCTTEVTPRALGIARAFTDAGLAAAAVGDVTGLLWGKLLINVGINPLTGLLQVRNGRLVELPDADALLEDAVLEALRVAQQKGIAIPFPDPVAKVREVARLTAQNISSMRSDVMNHKPTEIDYICGAVVRAGRETGVPTPINETLLRLVKSLNVFDD
jgi:2-dehydropantoate 2-reductase